MMFCATVPNVQYSFETRTHSGAWCVSAGYGLACFLHGKKCLEQDDENGPVNALTERGVLGKQSELAMSDVYRAVGNGLSQADTRTHTRYAEALPPLVVCWRDLRPDAGSEAASWISVSILAGLGRA